MYRLRWLLTVPLGVVILVFAMSNRENVALSLWPFPFLVQLPVFLLVLGSGAAGLLLGAFLLWLPMLHWRRKARRYQQSLERLGAAQKAGAPPAGGGEERA